MGMRDTYAYAIQTAKGKFHGNAEEREGKLHFKGKDQLTDPDAIKPGQVLHLP
jgi:nucleoid-associated protein YgaU